MGTPLYFSPEQSEQYMNSKIKREVDEKVDIYALGLVLLEMTYSITTTHEKFNSFNYVKDKRLLPPESKL